MAHGIESTTPEFDKLTRTHGRSQNMEVDLKEKVARYQTPRGEAKIPMEKVHVEEVKNRVAEQQENVKLANKRIGQHPDTDSTVTGKWGILGY